MLGERARVASAMRWVIKIGSAMVTNHGAGIDYERIESWVGDIAALHRAEKSVVLVSSGAVAAGMQKLGLQSRPTQLSELQAAAAVGQMGLLEAYEKAFEQYGVKTAQVLITHDDCADRRRYLNIRMTVQALLNYGVVPIVNENDVVAYDELRFGDNDSIGALMANLVEAELYVMLTDQLGLFTANPSLDSAATLISTASAEDKQLLALADGGGRLGSGGMQTKLLAAQRAARSGAASIIASGAVPNVIAEIANGREVGTLLLPAQNRQAARKQWLMSRLQVAGKIIIDEGAARAIVEQGRSVLPVGVVSVDGAFLRGELISICRENGQEFARGLSNYTAQEATNLKGLRSDAIRLQVGEQWHRELVHRDNLVLI